MTDSPQSFDLFTCPNGLGLEDQRAFELWWKRQTGRSAIVIQDFTYKETLEYK